MPRLRAAPLVAVAAVLAAAAPAGAAPPHVIAPPPALGPGVTPYVSRPGGDLVLRDVRLIDGTGASEQSGRTIVLHGERIVAVGGPELKAPEGAAVLDLEGRTVIPGLVGMHDHIFYIGRPNLDAAGHSDSPLTVPEMAFSSPRLYLAAGVTTLRTTGSIEPYTDLDLKSRIDQGALPGPHMDVTGPYIGDDPAFPQMHPLKDAADARRLVAYWADMGATSFKAYTHITRAELKAAVEEAHRRGLKITGHLCSVTYPEAAALGIDNLEHGFFVNTELDPGKQPDVCPPTVGNATLAAMEPGSPAGEALIRLLVSKHVAVTSTLPVFEQRVPGHSPLNPKAMAVLTPEAREAYLYARNLTERLTPERAEAARRVWRNDLALERRFVEAGGLLMGGPDPTGNGGVIPGFGDQREVELLTEAGFTAEAAIRIATLNGAVFLGLDHVIGTVEPGKLADLVIVRGDPARRIADIENVELVLKDGVAYDPDKLLASVKGRYGEY